MRSAVPKSEKKCKANRADSDQSPVGNACHICDPSSPGEAVPAPDETPCSDDGDICTLDHCVNGTCTHLPATGPACDDGAPCTSDDLCTAGNCAGTAYGCDDGLECTGDQCNGDGTCAHPLLAGTCLVGGKCLSAGDKDGPGCLASAPQSPAVAWATRATRESATSPATTVRSWQKRTGFCAMTRTRAR